MIEAKQIVIQAEPKAQCRPLFDNPINGYEVHSWNGTFSHWLGGGATEDAAWEDAAKYVIQGKELNAEKDTK